MSAFDLGLALFRICVIADSIVSFVPIVGPKSRNVDRGSGCDV